MNQLSKSLDPASLGGDIASPSTISRPPSTSIPESPEPIDSIPSWTAGTINSRMRYRAPKWSPS